MNLNVVPFSVRLPTGYSFPTGGAGAQAPQASSASVSSQMTAGGPAPGATDVIAFSNSWKSGAITAQAGDTYRMGDLFKGSTTSGQPVAGYRVALGGAGGQLLLDGVDVAGRSSFTADEFAHLTFV